MLMLVVQSQDLKKSEETLCTEDEIIEARKREECVSGGDKVKRKLIACRKALLSLDAAADSVVQLFSELQTLDSEEEISSRPGGELYFEVTGLLPSIMEKVNMVAKLVQSCNNQQCGKTETH